jgi:hypothetical protein
VRPRGPGNEDGDDREMIILVPMASRPRETFIGPGYTAPEVQENLQ